MKRILKSKRNAAVASTPAAQSQFSGTRAPAVASGPAAPASCHPKPPRAGAARPAGSAGSSFTPAEETRFHQLYSENRGWVLSTAIRAGVLDPESVAQQALWKALVKHDPARGSLRSFLRKVLSDELAGAYRVEVRARGLCEPLPEGFDAVDESALDSLARFEFLDLLGACVSREQQQLLLWKYEDELSVKEIAAKL